MSVSIHPTALVDKKAHLEKGVSVGPYAVISGDVFIGEGTSIGSHVVVDDGTRLGSHCTVFNGASIGTRPQDLKYSGEKTTLRIGNHTTIREFCTLNRGTSARGETTVGSHCLIMAYCHIAHDCIVGDHVIISNNLAMAGHVEVGNHVTIGGVVPIHQFTRIGDYAFIGAKTYCNMDIVPFSLAAGEPPRIRGLNRIGLERRGFDAQRLKTLKTAYSILFRKKLSLADAIARLESDYADNEDVHNIVSFARTSERGLMRM